MESIEKLRGLRDEAARKMVDNPRWVCAKCEEIADEIEREIAERYMELSLDVDGVPIHVGDVMCCLKHGIASMKVLAVSDIYFWRQCETGIYPSIAESFHHVKPDPVKELLRDYCVDIAHQLEADPDKTISESTIADYAERIRQAVKS